jgi:amidohydrolase
MVFIQAGALEGVNRFFSLHMASDMPVGPVGIKSGANNASVDYFRLTVRGKSAHVSTPHQGIDALYVACQIVTALQGIVTRQLSPIETVIIGVGRHQAGTAYNIVAETAEIEGTLRTFSPEIREFARRRIIETAESMAAAYRGFSSDKPEVLVDWKEWTAVLSNDPALCPEAVEIAAALVGRDQVITSRPLSLGGDDAAEFLLRVPGVYAFVGSGNPALPNTILSHHNSRFDIDEEAVITAAALYALYGARYLGMK